MSETLIFLLGLVCGWLLCLLSDSFSRERAEQQNFQSQLKTYDAIFEQYLDLLAERQDEIRQEIESWVTNVKRRERPASSEFRINQARANQVLELIKQGYNTVEVAQKLGLGVGEVELIRQLKNSELAH